MTEIHHTDILASADNDYIVSLVKLTGLPIIDIQGYFTDSFGLDAPVFKLKRVVFAEGKSLDVEGEHDLPYFSVYENAPPNFDDETASRLYNEANPDDDDE